MQPAAPPFTQRDLLHLAAERLGTLDDTGEVKISATANAFGYQANGDRRIRRLLGRDKTNATLHWDEAWKILTVLGWINEPAVRRDLQRRRLAEARRQAAAAEQKTSSSRAGRGRRARG